MPFADPCRAAMTLAWRRTGRAAGALALGSALALALALALAVASPALAQHAAPHGAHHQKVNHNNDGDDDDNGGASSAGATSSPGAANAGGDSNTGGANNAGGANLGGGLGADRNKGSGPNSGLNTGLLGNGSAGGPTLGLGFNNNSASASLSIPFGGGHALPHLGDHEQRPGARLLAIPFDHHAGLTHALSYGEAGAPGGLFGGSPALTNRLIHSVTTTYSDRFVKGLNHSLHAAHTEGATAATTANGGADSAGTLGTRINASRKAVATAVAAPATVGTAAAVAPRNPATVVSERFAGIDGHALQARLFTIPMAGETRYVRDEVVVGVPTGLSTAQIAEVARRNGLAPVTGGTFASSGLVLQRWRIVDNRTVAEVIRGLQGEAALQSAQPNFRFALAQSASAGYSEQPADGFSTQYAPAKLHLAQAHRLSVGRGVIVAVIDTGIDRLHPELAGAIVAGFDAIGDKEPPDTHGTAIAGAIVAHARLTGVAPGARLLAIRAFSTVGPDAEATTMTIVRSIEYAMAQGARVINMSFAGARDPLIARAIAEARRRGIVLVAAAGNAGPQSPPLYPAADANVIAVSATDIDDHLLDVANRGRQIAVAAPGVDILLPAPHARYQIATGTSFAAAHVAGIVALMLAKNPHLTPDQVRAALIATARDLGPKGRDDMFGAGLADAYRAVLAVTTGAPQTVAVAVPPLP